MNGREKDELVCSTWQTALLKNLPESLPYVDIIIVDEAHNTSEESELSSVIEAFSAR